MKVCLDLRCIRPGMTGVGVSALHMARALLQYGRSHEFIGIFLAGCAPEDLKDSGMKIIETNADYQRHPAGEFWLNFTLPRILKKESVDICHGAAFLIPWRKTSFKKIVSIHDMIAFRFPHTYSKTFGNYIKCATRLSARFSNRIIVPSENTKTDLVKICQIPPDKVDVVPHFADPFFQPIARNERESHRALLNLPPKYILNVGALEPRKNQTVLIKAFEMMRSETNLTHHLLLVGGKGYRGDEILDAISRSPHAAAIRHFTRVDILHLYTICALADLFVFPSHYEGFGLPALEAMACGTPVIAANAASLPEIVADAGVLVPPDSQRQLADEMINALSNQEKLVSLSERGLARAKAFTPERTAAALLAIYEKVCGK